MLIEKTTTFRRLANVIIKSKCGLIKNYIYLLLTEFEGRTVSYRTSLSTAR